MTTWFLWVLTAFSITGLLVIHVSRTATPDSSRWMEFIFWFIGLILLLAPFCKTWSPYILVVDLEGPPALPISLTLFWVIAILIRNVYFVGSELYGVTRLMGDSRIIPEDAEHWLMNGFKKKAHSPVALYLSPFISEPLSLGILKPRIIMPSHWFPEELLGSDPYLTANAPDGSTSRDLFALQAAYAHELGHYSERDGLRNILRLTLLALLPLEVVFGPQNRGPRSVFAPIINAPFRIIGEAFREIRRLREIAADEEGSKHLPAVSGILDEFRAGMLASDAHPKRRFSWFLAFSAWGVFLLLVLGVALPSIYQMGLSIGTSGGIPNHLPLGWAWEPMSETRLASVTYEPPTRLRPPAVVSKVAGVTHARAHLVHQPTTGLSTILPGERFIVDWEYELSAENGTSGAQIRLVVVESSRNSTVRRVLRQVRTIFEDSAAKVLPNGRKLGHAELLVTEGVTDGKLSLALVHTADKPVAPGRLISSTLRAFAPKVWRIRPDGTKELLP